MNTRRILTVRSEFGQNGPGTQSLEIAKEMKKRGHYVIFASNGGEMKSEIEKDFTHYWLSVCGGVYRSDFLLWDFNGYQSKTAWTSDSQYAVARVDFWFFCTSWGAACYDSLCTGVSGRNSGKW